MRTRRGRKDHVRSLLQTAALVGLASLVGTGSEASRAGAAGPVFRPGSWISKTLHKLKGDSTPTSPPTEPPVEPPAEPSVVPTAASPSTGVPMPPPPVPGMDPFESLPESAPGAGASPNVATSPNPFRPISSMREIGEPEAAPAAPVESALSIPDAGSGPAAAPFLAPPAGEAPEAVRSPDADPDADVPFLDFNAPLPKRRSTEAAPVATSSPNALPAAAPLPAALPRVPASAAAAAAQVHQGGKIASFDLAGGTLVLDLAPGATLEPGTKLLVYHRFNLGRVSTVCEIVVRSSEPGTAVAQPLAPSSFSRMAIGDTAVVIP